MVILLTKKNIFTPAGLWGPASCNMKQNANIKTQEPLTLIVPIALTNVVALGRNEQRDLS